MPLAENALLFASDLIEHDGDLRDLPLIDRKRRLAELIGKAKRRAVTRDRQTAFPKNWSLRNMPGALSVRGRAKLHHSRMRPPLLMKA